jgi:hypothetical protein
MKITAFNLLYPWLSTGKQPAKQRRTPRSYRERPKQHHRIRGETYHGSS